MTLTDEDRARILAAINAENGTATPYVWDDLHWMNETAYLAGLAAGMERAAVICDRFAGYMEQGAGEIEPGKRLRQVAAAIRAAKDAP